MKLPHDALGAGAAPVLLHAGIADPPVRTEHLAALEQPEALGELLLSFLS